MHGQAVESRETKSFLDTPYSTSWAHHRQHPHKWYNGVAQKLHTCWAEGSTPNGEDFTVCSRAAAPTPRGCLQHPSEGEDSFISDMSHPGHPLFELLPSDKWYRLTQSHTNRLKNSFFPSAVASITSHSTHIHYNNLHWSHSILCNYWINTNFICLNIVIIVYLLLFVIFADIKFCCTWIMTIKIIIFCFCAVRLF